MAYSIGEGAGGGGGRCTDSPDHRLATSGYLEVQYFETAPYCEGTGELVWHDGTAYDTGSGHGGSSRLSHSGLIFEESSLRRTRKGSETDNSRTTRTRGEPKTTAATSVVFFRYHES